ncbi:MAG TPA: hypothetical protein VKU80_12060 [Planctomycetota bacterium]|nr:hypothetical protein [Planctomycetota bacterium]
MAEVCIVFFALVYYSGRGFARLFRAPGLADEIKHRGDWPLTILGVLLGLVLASRLWFTTKHGWHRFDGLAALVLIAGLLVLTIVFKLGLGFRREPPQESQ